MARSSSLPFLARRIAASAPLMIVWLALASGCGQPIGGTSVGDKDDSTGPPLATPAAADAPDSSAEAAATALTSTEQPATSGASGGVKVSGQVIFEGTVPERRAINTAKDAKCAELHGDKPLLDEDLLVADGGGVKNAFVFIRRGAPKADYPMPEAPATLDQKGCMFQPRVQGIRVGQRLLVGNIDPVTHNVRSFPKANRAFNFGQPPGTGERERVFERAEREIEVQCDIHPWMHAYIFVMDHPFYCVSQDDGMYHIDALPPGEYTLEAWHEKLGRQRTTITVGQVDLADVNFKYPG